MNSAIKILFVGDIVGSAGRHAVLGLLPGLLTSHKPDFVIVNGENAAGGRGITPEIAEDLYSAGVDAITLGNHAYRQSKAWPMLDEDPRIVRPANHFRSNPGRGATVVEKNGVKLGVLNLSGNFGLDAAHPFIAAADSGIHELGSKSDLIFVDFHAEATSEKIALGWHLDGRVAAVVGTHTHVPTADARILPGGTAYITDVGMTGSRDGVIGVERDLAIKSMTSNLPVRFEPASSDPWLNGVLITTAGPDSAATIEQLLLPA
ncbi:MAG: TIGR00282 family metallophosphoesterase [Solirubrobacterales bacterium]|nr:TIGR00282 family metallophosphoesterase [Solirubrobacterales bacterium]